MEVKEKKELILPQQISLIGMIQSRCSEINQLINDIKSRSPKLASQRLPIHMRRRAASHNINRLPAKTRALVNKKKQGQGSGDTQEKRKKKHDKSRKAVVASQVQREAKPDRTLLHLWFAKRFKMLKLFNSTLPSHNNTKNQRKIHKNSKDDCVHFHLSHFKCIIVQIGNFEFLSQKLNEMTTDELQQIFKDTLEAGSKNVQFYENKNGQLEMLGPGRLIYIKSANLLLIWIHISIHDKLLETLTESLKDSQNNLINGENIYQSFCLFGSKSLDYLKKTLESSSFLPDKFMEGTFWNTSVSQISNSESVGSHVDLNCVKIFIAEMKKYKNREAIILTVPFSESKEFWFKLVRNRSHLVGGLRDLQTLLCETNCLNFPSTGYPDSLLEFNLDRDSWSQIMMINSKNGNYNLLRDTSTIDTIKNDLHIETIENLLQSIPKLIQSFIYIEVICLNRGVPSKGDIICLPSEDDVSKYLGLKPIDVKLSNIGYGPEESNKLIKCPSLEKSSRKVIGMVEYGHFSYDDGVGKGMAAITLSSLPDLIKIKKIDLLALTRSNKSTTFRFVKIIIDNFQYF